MIWINQLNVRFCSGESNMTDPLHNIWGYEDNKKIIAISPNSELGNLPSFQDTHF